MLADELWRRVARSRAHCVPDLPVIYAQYLLLSSNSRKVLWSHAYSEGRHVAQSFALPNFPGTQHHALIRRGREHRCASLFFWEEGLSEGF